MTSRSFARRGLSWSNALRDMRADRQDRAAVREERLRTTRSPAIALSAWRGRSGRRYIVQVHTLAAAASIEAPGAVILGVRRKPDSVASLVGVGHRGSVAEACALAAADGATEIHLHRLAETDDARDAIVEDLVGDDPA